MAGEDVIAAAQTGTGKTASFALPMLQRLFAEAPRSSGPRAVRGLVLVPTRELALQVSESLATYGAHLPLRFTTLFGGVSIVPQLKALRRGCDIVVATPGRLLDHLGRETVWLDQVQMLVLDEADRMLDMGFVHDIRRVLATLPPRRQNLLFSATFSDPIRTFAEGLLHSPRRIDVAPRNSTVKTVRQKIVRVGREGKTEALAQMIHAGGWEQVLVFTRTKHGANRLARKLEQADLSADAIHGNKSQNARVRALSAFKRGQLRVLVATDIAARGLDIDGLPHVVNFELPNVPEDYVHRIGRTGRAGAEGEALSLVAPEEAPLLRDIERLIGVRFDAAGLAEHSAAGRGGAPRTSGREAGRAHPRADKEPRRSGGRGFHASKPGPSPKAGRPGARSDGRPNARSEARSEARSARGPGARSGNRSDGGASARAGARPNAGPGSGRPSGRERSSAGTPSYGPRSRGEGRERTNRTRPGMGTSTGSVKWFNAKKGYGFIAPDAKGEDIFVHVSVLERAGIPSLGEGQKVEFDVTARRDGRSAAQNLRLL